LGLKEKSVFVSFTISHHREHGDGGLHYPERHRVEVPGAGAESKNGEATPRVVAQHAILSAHVLEAARQDLWR